MTNGVFKNCIAIFKSFKSDERVILLMNLLGQPQELTIKQESLNALWFIVDLLLILFSLK